MQNCVGAAQHGILMRAWCSLCKWLIHHYKLVTATVFLQFYTILFMASSHEYYGICFIGTDLSQHVIAHMHGMHACATSDGNQRIQCCMSST